MENPLQAAHGGGIDVFVAKLNASDFALVFSTYLGGNGDDYASGSRLIAIGSGWVAVKCFRDPRH